MSHEEPSGRLVPHRGGMILTFGILGLLLCGPFTAIPAWIMGSGDLAQIDARRMDPSGRGLTQAGYILGIIGTSLFGVGVVIWLIVFVILASNVR